MTSRFDFFCLLVLNAGVDAQAFATQTVMSKTKFTHGNTVDHMADSVRVTTVRRG